MIIANVQEDKQADVNFMYVHSRFLHFNTWLGIVIRVDISFPGNGRFTRRVRDLVYYLRYLCVVVFLRMSSIHCVVFLRTVYPM